MIVLSIAILALCAAPPTVLRPPAGLNIFPKPSRMTALPGSFHFRKHATIYASSGVKSEARLLATLLAKGAISTSIKDLTGRAESEGSVYLEVDKSMAKMGKEAYALTITAGAVKIRAAGAAGIYYGIQSVRQLLPSQIEDPKLATAADWKLPCAQIVDRPRFEWRGMLLDVSRHFFPKQDIKHFLDLLAMHKMNVFHWHLTDDGGWRIEIKKYPNLTKVGAWRTASKEIWDYTHLNFPGPGTHDELYGGYYTQADVREIVRYASERHITIVPEIEMPGHSLASIASYPELGCNVPAAGFTKVSGLPSSNVYCAGKETTFRFLKDVVDEVSALFPAKTLHIGGDEVDKYLWKNCADCQARMKEEDLKSPEELQSYFIRRAEKIVNAKGKQLMGWDEILEGGLAPNASVMSWRGFDGGIAAAKAGHDVVMTPTSHCYFDYSYQNISTEHVLEFEPVPSTLMADQGTHILGGQCNLWTEWVADMPTAEQRLFPRILAMAEVLWSEHSEEDPDAFDARLAPYYSRLLALGVNFYIPKPTADFDAVLLNGPASVTFGKAPLPGAVIRFTTDGTAPTELSPVCDGPLSITKPGTITAALFLTGQKSDSTQIGVAAYSPVTPSSLQPGLNWRAFDESFLKVPEYSTMVASAAGTTDSVTLVGGRKTNYALEITGYLKIEKDGVYRLYVSSDDGSALWLGGAKVVDNDGLHGGIEKSGRVFLRSGYYPLAVGYFQAGGGQSLSAAIEGPEMHKQPIPLSMLWRG